MKGTILIIEDEASIREIVRTYLEQEGFQVICGDDGAQALTLTRQHRPDLIILDLNLPGMDGLEITARIRAESDVYILMLTARAEEVDRVAGLRIGADDYLTKPFSPRELVARVQAILRRHRGATGSEAEQIVQLQNLRILPERHEVWVNEQRLELTGTEFKVLLELAQQAGRVLSREQLIDRVWGMDFYGNDRVVDVYVGQVRRKLEEATGQALIRTVRGIGYKFEEGL